jgi:hypothetical protein
MLTPGDPAPTFTAPNQHGESVRIDVTDPTVVYFYPKDFTAGCTIGATDFQSALPEFRKVGIDVYGVSISSPAGRPRPRHGRTICCTAASRSAAASPRLSSCLARRRHEILPHRRHHRC